MADDPKKQGKGDRDRVSGSEEHEVAYFARTNGVTPEQTLELIKAHGNDRATLEREAKKLNGG